MFEVGKGGVHIKLGNTLVLYLFNLVVDGVHVKLGKALLFDLVDVGQEGVHVKLRQFTNRVEGFEREMM